MLFLYYTNLIHKKDDGQSYSPEDCPRSKASEKPCVTLKYRDLGLYPSYKARPYQLIFLLEHSYTLYIIYGATRIRNLRGLLNAQVGRNAGKISSFRYLFYLFSLMVKGISLILCREIDKIVPSNLR